MSRRFALFLALCGACLGAIVAAADGDWSEVAWAALAGLFVAGRLTDALLNPERRRTR